MNKQIIVVIIVFYLFLSMESTSYLFFSEQDKFCQKNGFDYAENTDNSHACWKDEGTKIVVKKTQCNSDLISMLTFRNPYQGCKFKEIS